MSEQSTSVSSSVLKSTGLALVVGFVIPVLVIVRNGRTIVILDDISYKLYEERYCHF